MQYFIKQRATLEGAITFHTPAIDVSGVAALVHTLILYGITGVGAGLTIQPQTSEDLETWSNFGTSVALSAAGQGLGADDVLTNTFGRYIRYEISLVGTTPTCIYSVILNTHQSS